MKKYSFSGRSKQKHYRIFLLPSLLGVASFVLLPFAEMIRRSFYTAVQGVFCGFANYKAVFTNQAFLLAFKNTACFVGVGLPVLIVLSLLLSLALDGARWGQQLKSVFLFPVAVPTAALVLIWKLFFHKNGIINACFQEIGVPVADWLGSDLAFWVLIISYIWKNMGYTVVLWHAGMKHIPMQLTEAAKVDGASAWQRFRYITLPMLKPTFFTIAVLSFLNSFKVFREAYLVSGAYPQKKMYLLQHLFNNWFIKLDVDKMSAAAVCIALVFAGFVLVLGKGEFFGKGKGKFFGKGKWDA